MKNILMIAYYYPPLGGAGVQRSLKFAKYLSKSGYNVSVLTVENEHTSVKDESLNAEISDNIKVYRVAQSEKNFFKKAVNKIINSKNSNNSVTKVTINKSNGTSRILKRNVKNLLLKIYSTFFIPDDKLSWKENAINAALEIIKKDNIELIFSTSSPYTSHLIANALKKKTNLPWISDFRDQWVNNPFATHSFIVDFVNKILEKKVVTSADAVISVSSPIIKDFLNRYKNLPRSKFKEITNGYDEEDFLDFDINYIPKQFIIAYNGSLYGKESPKNFFCALDNLISSKKIDEKEIKVRFIGQIGRDARNDILQFSDKYKAVVECIDYMPHLQSLKQLENSSALLLILESGLGSNGIYTGKIFEYIRSGRNIIGIVPDGVARDLIKETNTGYCCYPESIAEIMDAVYKCYMNWNNSLPKLNIDWENVKAYNRENLTMKLIEIIKEQS